MSRRKAPIISKREQERQEFLAWRSMHGAAHQRAMQALEGKGESAAEYWAKVRADNESKRRGAVAQVGLKPQPIASVKPHGPATDDLSLEELSELQRREAAANEETRMKRARTGPVYNKGNMVYLSDDLLRDIQAGNTRRRP